MKKREPYQTKISLLSLPMCITTSHVASIYKHARERERESKKTSIHSCTKRWHLFYGGLSSLCPNEWEQRVNLCLWLWEAFALCISSHFSGFKKLTLDACDGCMLCGCELKSHGICYLRGVTRTYPGVCHFFVIS